MDVANEVSIPKVVSRLTASYSKLTITSYSSEYCVASGLDLVTGDYILIILYPIMGFNQVTVNMTWALFHGLMRKQSKERPPPSLADL